MLFAGNSVTDQNFIDKDNESTLFHREMQDVMRLPAPNTVTPRNSPVSPLPRKKKHSDQEVLDNTLSDHISLEMEAGDEWSFARPGISHQILKRLRRGHWKIQRTLDLHGLTRDEARQELSIFLSSCLREQHRCVRVIHGKGLSSKDREPVLKTRIGNWLIQCAYVLAFCQTRPEEGGSGAVVVLLKTASRPE